jgi:hypothetical protein
VRLDIVYCGGFNAGLPERATHHVLLRRTARGHDPVGVPVLVDCTADDRRQHAISIVDSVHKSLEHDDGAALAAAITVRGGVE